VIFALVILMLLINWGFHLYSDENKDNCEGIQLAIRNVGSNEVCYSSSEGNLSLHFILENKGAADINGIVIWIFGEKGTVLKEISDISVRKDSLYDARVDLVDYDLASYGALNEVQFIPKKNSLCPKEAAKTASIGVC